MTSKNFQIQQDIPWQQPDPKIKRQIYGYNHELMMVKVVFETGGIGTVHQHPHTQVTYVESGKFEMTIGDETVILTKGDGYFVPPHIPHGCICLEAGMLVDSFSPMREDMIIEY
jgi:quercetin dioxygenase-like cupin family protein